MQLTVIATAFYARIREAFHIGLADEKVRYYKQLLETLFRELTKKETRSFGNLFARMQFFFDKENAPRDLKNQVMVARTLTMKAIRGMHMFSEEEHLQCLKAISNLIEWYYQAAPPEDLLFIHNTPGQLSLKKDNTAKQDIPVLKGMIRAVNGTVLQLTDEENEDFTLQLDAMLPATVLSLQTMLRAYDTVNIFHCKPGNHEHEYIATPESQLILEPDLLIDISDLAECFTHRGCNRLLYLVKKLLPQNSGPAAFRGNLVNTLLDDMLRKQATNLKRMFMEAVAENVMQAAAYGREELNKMYRDIQTVHWNNLQNAVKELGNGNVSIEPTFFSAQYGLQGRLDVMTQDETENTRKEIYELKSGKAPDFNTWKNHEMQVVGYNLLLRSTFGPGRKGSSAILYSAAASNPLRNVSSTHFLENELLTLRNEIVAMLLRLAAGEMEILNAICPENATGVPPFSSHHFSAFQQAYSTAPPEFKAYYQQYLAFTLREFLQAKCGMFSAVNREEEADGFAALWLQDEKEKLKKFNIIPGLRFREFDTVNSVVQFDLLIPVNHNFRVNDTAVIYPRTSAGLRPLKQQLLKGRIEDLGKHHLSFSLINRQMTLDFFRQFDEWVIEHDMYESNYWSAAASLYYIIAPQFADKTRLLLGLRAPGRTPLTYPPPAMFNDNQALIVKQALEANDYFLLQGPPGTGKTSTLLTTIVNETVKQGRTTVIVAFTNKAVEEICSKLESRAIRHLRIGSKNTEAGRMLQQYCLGGSLDEARNFIAGHRVFVATVATMSSRLEQLLMMGVAMDTLIVDEASQLTEPQVLGLLMPFKKFILIGDQNQLPPVVAQDDSFCTCKQEQLTALGIRDLRTSLFERLMQCCKKNNWKEAWGMLSTHFRMHETIAAMVNHYYAGQLNSGRPEQQLPFEQNASTGEGWERILSAGRKIFINSPYESTSKMNKTEAQWVASLLRHLKQKYGPSLPKDRVGVVTPWRTQISLIRELLADDEMLQSINIDTVERFQGSENDIIIASLAVHHPAQLQTLQSIGWFDWEEKEIEVDRKLLVTLSRARQQVILLGHEPVLQSSAHYRKILSEMTQSRL